MDTSNFDFSYPPPPISNSPNVVYTEAQHLQLLQSQQWAWANQQYMQSQMGPAHFHPNQLNTNYPPPPPMRPHGYHNNVPGPRHFSPRGRYMDYYNGPPQTWLRTNYKRTRSESEDPSEPKSKIGKKKKKPLSQNVPGKRDWTMDEADKAITVEKQFNKCFKNQSLIIKFPDPDLNKDIVSSFHSLIDNVHFQQPSTARFCFVTLKETADADAVITSLNKQPFGNGFLIAEHKKDREDDQNIGPGDIDPLTLYVGNLAQEVTKEDMVKAFPKCRRIDIGYAKKMKYTRYAFVNFKNVNDSIAAFKQTHSTEMYSKSLIVRFRRLHGTVGMPGESKPQNPPKPRDDEPVTSTEAPMNVEDYPEGILYSDKNDKRAKNSSTSTLPITADSTAQAISEEPPVKIKAEPSPEEDIKPMIDLPYDSPFVSGCIFEHHRPKVKSEIKTEIKTEDKKVDVSKQEDTKNFCTNNQVKVKQEEIDAVHIKEEPNMSDDSDQGNYEYYDEYNSGDESILNDRVDFDQLYRSVLHSESVIQRLREKD